MQRKSSSVEEYTARASSNLIGIKAHQIAGGKVTPVDQVLGPRSNHAQGQARPEAIECAVDLNQ